MLNWPVPSAPIEPQPQRQVHLRAPRRRDVAEVDDRPPTHPKVSSSSATWSFAPSSLPQTNTLVDSPERPGRDHHARVHRVQGLHHPRLRKRALNPLPEAVVVAHRQRRRHALAEVERVRDVDQDLPGQVVGPRRLERLQRAPPAGRVDHHLAELRRIGERALARTLAGLRRPGSTAFSFPARRDPILTSWPSSTSLPPIACPTVPVPKTPNRISPSLQPPRSPSLSSVIRSIRHPSARLQDRSSPDGPKAPARPTYPPQHPRDRPTNGPCRSFATASRGDGRRVCGAVWRRAIQLPSQHPRQRPTNAPCRSFATASGGPPACAGSSCGGYRQAADVGRSRGCPVGGPPAARGAAAGWCAR